MRNKKTQLKAFSIKHLGYPCMLLKVYKKISTNELAAFNSLLRYKPIHSNFYFQTWPCVGFEKDLAGFYRAAFSDLFGDSDMCFEINIDFN